MKPAERPIPVVNLADIPVRAPVHDPGLTCDCPWHKGYQAFLDWSADVAYERARLAMLDPEGEKDAVAPPDPVKAQQTVAERRPLIRITASKAMQSGDRTLLDRLGCDPSKDKGMIRCPGPLHPHGDRNKSLSWRWTGEKVLLKCFVGCSFEDIRAALK